MQGSPATNCVPVPGRDSIVRGPISKVTRSRMPTSQ